MNFRLLLCCLLFTGFVCANASGEELLPGLQFERGPVNRVVMERQGQKLAVYAAAPGTPDSLDWLLLTHHRRDVLRAARQLSGDGVATMAPAAERALIDRPGQYWQEFTTARFHDYDQQSTKVLASPLKVSRWVSGGDTLAWQGLDWTVVDTPGFTRGSVSWFVEIDDQRVVFSGDLIYGNGQLLDLYSLQDAIPEAKVRGYHGYAARLASVVASLKSLQQLRPTMIIPARGPVIHEPDAAINRLIRRVQALYANYLSTNALHWYFKKDRMTICGRRVLGDDATVELMPYSHYEDMPGWIFAHSTSRVLISESGHGFLLDCGSLRSLDAVKKLISDGRIKSVDGIFVTHHHDDHTDMVAAAGWEFDCPVYCLDEYMDVLRHPEAYHIPAMTDNPIPQIQAKRDGETMTWREFELQFLFFPGQTFYHGALRVKRGAERPVLFIGDAFAPSGFDDYCLLNRNLVHEDTGYLRCLKTLKGQPEPYWLINEHIPHVFAYSDDEMDYLETRYRERIDMLRELLPWDDPNYGIDEQWAACYPYGATLRPGATTTIQVRIVNHSPVERVFRVRFHGHRGVQTDDTEYTCTIPPRQTGHVTTQVRAPRAAGIGLVTADVRSDGMEFDDWCECLITVE